MKEHGTIFSGDMPCKILDRLKTQTRRPVNRSNTLVDGNTGRYPYWDEFDFDDVFIDPGPSPAGNAGPYLKVARNWEGGPTRHRLYPQWSVGDRLWVRETWCITRSAGDSRVGYGKYVIRYKNGPPGEVNYADAAQDALSKMFHTNPRWLSPIYMPRWASRILLEVTRVWPERVQDIDILDVLEEGTPDIRTMDNDFDMGDCFRKLWDSLYAKKPEYQWAANGWVWALEFKVVEK